MTNLELTTSTPSSTQTTPITTSERLASIDALTGLRFVAAGLVYLTHLYGASSASKMLPSWIGNIMQAGYLGVSLFFVLSGFVITYNYYDKLAQPTWPAVRDFFVARFARIYPLYFVVLIFVLSAYNLGDELKEHSGVLAQHFLMIQAWNPDAKQAQTYNTPGWSIGVEIFFYLLFPLIAWQLLSRLHRTWQLLTLAGVAYGAKVILVVSLSQNYYMTNPDGFLIRNYWLTRSPLGHLSAFVLGCVAAKLYLKYAHRLPTRRENFWGSLGLLIAAGSTITLMALDRSINRAVLGVDVLFLPLYTLIIFGLARYHNWLSRLLGSRLMVLLGEASYAFYLLHFYFIYSNAESLSRVGQPSAFLRGIMVFGLTVVTSVGAFVFIETPARRFIRGLGRKRANVSKE